MTKAEIEKRMNDVQEQLNKAYETFGPLLKEWSELKAQLNEPEKKTGWEKPAIGQAYWHIDNIGVVTSSTWDNDPIDHARFDSGNCFTSEELAANVSVYKSLDSRIRRRIAEICEPVDWNNTDQTKYCILGYHHPNKMFELGVEQYSQYHYGLWACDSGTHAKQIIEEFKDELVWYFTEFKDRTDGQEG